MSSLPEVQDHRHKFSRDDVERMLDAGILDESAGVELLEGDLVVMSPQNPVHSGLTEVVRTRLESALGPGFHGRTHAPVDAGQYSQPEPDVALVRGRSEDFVARHPTARETLLVVEIARSSPARDRRKSAIYAKAGFRESWLFDLEARTVEVQRDPRETEYATHVLVIASDTIPIPGSTEALHLASLFALLPP